MERIIWMYLASFNGECFFKNPEGAFKKIKETTKLSDLPFTKLRYVTPVAVCEGLTTVEEEDVTIHPDKTLKEFVKDLPAVTMNLEELKKLEPKKPKVNPYSVNYKTIFDWD